MVWTVMFKDTKEIKGYLDILFDPNYSLDPKTRDTILGFFRSYDKPRLDVLLEYRIDDIPYIRRQMVFSLITDSGNPVFVNYFREIFYRSNNIKTKKLIVSSLSKIDDESVLLLLDDIVNSKEYFNVKKETQKAYDKWYVKRPVKYYLNSLREGGKNLKNLKVAADAIIKSKDPTVINDLVEMLNLDDPVLIREVANIIFKIDPVSFYFKIEEKFEFIFKDIKKELEVNHRINTIISENNELVFNQNIIRLIRDILNDENVVNLLNSVVISFKKGQDNKAMQLLSRIKHQSGLECYKVLHETFYILSKDGYEKACSFLTRSEKHHRSYISIFLESAKALLKVMCKAANTERKHIPKLVALIRDLINSSEESYVSLAIEAGVYLDTPEFIQMVLEKYDHLSNSLRYLLAENMANLKDDRSLELLIKLAMDINPNVSVKGMESCFRRNYGERIVQEIQAMNNIAFMSNLITAIGNTCQKDYAGIVLNSLESDNTNLLMSSMNALKQIHLREALGPVKKIIKTNTNKRVLSLAISLVPHIADLSSVDFLFDSAEEVKDNDLKADFLNSADELISHYNGSIENSAHIKSLKKSIIMITDIKHRDLRRAICRMIKHISIRSVDDFKDLQKLINDTLNSLQLKGMEFSEEIDIVTRAKSRLMMNWENIKKKEMIQTSLNSFAARSIAKSKTDRESFYEFLEKTLNIYEITEDPSLMNMVESLVESIIERFLFLDKSEIIKLLDLVKRLNVKLSVPCLIEIKENIKSRIIEEKIDFMLGNIFDENFDIYYHPSKVAIIDSSQFIHKRLNQQLQKSGYETFHYKDLDEALQDLQLRKNIGIIVLEPLVASNKAEEIIKRLSKAYPEEAFPRIFILSSVQDQAVVEKYLSLGTRKYLIKPRDINNISSHLQADSDADE